MRVEGVGLVWLTEGRGLGFRVWDLGFKVSREDLVDIALDGFTVPEERQVLRLLLRFPPKGLHPTQRE